MDYTILVFIFVFFGTYYCSNWDQKYHDHHITRRFDDLVEVKDWDLVYSKYDFGYYDAGPYFLWVREDGTKALANVQKKSDEYQFFVTFYRADNGSLIERKEITGELDRTQKFNKIYTHLLLSSKLRSVFLFCDYYDMGYKWCEKPYSLFKVDLDTFESIFFHRFNESYKPDTMGTYHNEKLDLDLFIIGGRQFTLNPTSQLSFTRIEKDGTLGKMIWSVTSNDLYIDYTMEEDFIYSTVQTKDWDPSFVYIRKYHIPDGTELFNIHITPRTDEVTLKDFYVYPKISVSKTADRFFFIAWDEDDAEENKTDTIFCYSKSTGKLLWKTSIHGFHSCAWYSRADYGVAISDDEQYLSFSCRINGDEKALNQSVHILRAKDGKYLHEPFVFYHPFSCASPRDKTSDLVFLKSGNLYACKKYIDVQNGKILGDTKFENFKFFDESGNGYHFVDNSIWGGGYEIHKTFLKPKKISFPRLFGTKGNEKVRNIIKQTFRRYGYENVLVHEFIGSFRQIKFMVLLLLVVMLSQVVFLISYFISTYLNLFLFLLMLLFMKYLIGFASKYDSLKRETKKNGGLVGENIYTILEPENTENVKKNIIFMAHYDTKSQGISILTRIIMFLILYLFGLVTPFLIAFGSVYQIFWGYSGFCYYEYSLIFLTFLIIVSGTTNIICFLTTGNKSFGSIDNGTSLSVVMELSRIFQIEKPENLRLMFLCTDAEEIGLLGSSAFVSFLEEERKKREKEEEEWVLKKENTFVVNFELVGNKSAKLGFEESFGILSKGYTDKELNEYVVRAANESGMKEGLVRIDSLIGSVADHIPFLNRNWKATMIVPSFFATGLNWVHAEKDNMQLVCWKKLQEVGSLCQKLVQIIDKDMKENVTKCFEGSKSFV